MNIDEVIQSVAGSAATLTDKLSEALHQFELVVPWWGLADFSVLDWFRETLAGWQAHPNVALSSSLAALAAVLALAAISQTRLVRRRLEKVKNEFFTAFRPKIIVRDVHAPHCQPDAPVEVVYSLCNVGSSPGEIIESVFFVDVQPWNSPRTAPRSNGQNAVGRTLINAGEAKAFMYHAELTWNRNLIKASDMLRLFFSGQITYVDGNGVVRQTSFCRAFDGSRERFFALRDPELEYAD